MRNIQKRPEPPSLTEHRCSDLADYDNYAAKDDLRWSLTTEQRGICCYCMQRIRPTDSAMKIEHWQCQSRYPDRRLDYSNLLSACRGGEGKRPYDQHCDTRKADSDLTYCPASHNVEVRIRYLGDGRIETDDGQLHSELENILNLNDSLLVKNRKGVLDAFRDRLQRESATTADLRRELANWNGDNGGTLNPFCQVVVYYLRKKLNLA